MLFVVTLYFAIQCAVDLDARAIETA